MVASLVVAWLTCTVCCYFRVAILAVSRLIIVSTKLAICLALRSSRTQFVVSTAVTLHDLSPVLDWAAGDFSWQYVA